MSKKMIVSLLGALCLFLSAKSITSAEDIKDEVFGNLSWNLLYEDWAEGTVQSVCATEDYIITIDNISDNPTDNDIVSAYYKNEVDENGKPVEQYTLAKRVSDTCWEHGNGMTYNPNTREIYVALYTNSTPENRGCIYVMDPDTLAYKRTIKVSDEYNLLGIDYKEDTNQYVIQTNVEGGYSFKLLDENFQIMEDLGEYMGIGKGDNFQDLAVIGDYILNFPLTLNQGIGDYLHIYSISQRALIATPQIDFRFENVAADEPESLCEIEPGVFLSAVNVIENDGARKIRFYKTDLLQCLRKSEFTVSFPQTDSSMPAEKKNMLFTDRTVSIACFGSAAIVMYLYYVHVKIERRRKELRTKRYRHRYALK